MGLGLRSFWRCVGLVFWRVGLFFLTALRSLFHGIGMLFFTTVGVSSTSFTVVDLGILGLAFTFARFFSTEALQVFFHHLRFSASEGLGISSFPHAWWDLCFSKTQRNSAGTSWNSAGTGRSSAELAGLGRHVSSPTGWAVSIGSHAPPLPLLQTTHIRNLDPTIGWSSVKEVGSWYACFAPRGAFFHAARFHSAPLSALSRPRLVPSQFRPITLCGPLPRRSDCTYIRPQPQQVDVIAHASNASRKCFQSDVDLLSQSTPWEAHTRLNLSRTSDWLWRRVKREPWKSHTVLSSLTSAGSFTARIMTVSSFSRSHFSHFISDFSKNPKPMSKRGQEQNVGEGSAVAKPKPLSPVQAKTRQRVLVSQACLDSSRWGCRKRH